MRLHHKITNLAKNIKKSKKTHAFSAFLGLGGQRLSDGLVGFWNSVNKVNKVSQVTKVVPWLLLQTDITAVAVAKLPQISRRGVPKTSPD